MGMQEHDEAWQLEQTSKARDGQIRGGRSRARQYRVGLGSAMHGRAGQGKHYRIGRAGQSRAAQSKDECTAIQSSVAEACGHLEHR